MSRTTGNDHEGHRERLRKQFREQEGAGFPEHQLLELLLTYAIRQKDVNPLAHQRLERYGSLSAVLRADVFELMRQEGIGEHTAVLLSLVGKLAPRAIYEPAEGQRILTSGEAIPLCRSLVGQSKQEELWVISLNHNHRVIHADKISSGTPTETPMYARLVVECALRHGAMGVLLCHNHPTGNAKPSPQDLEATEKVIRALEPLGITLYDHIIIGGKSAFSLWSEKHLSGGEAEETLLAAAERKE
ncbi:MAG: JAB domain-containing protein [Candidatus Pelethousia sp.]|nr:JAB domain-containing protein [Candidatus Pelethousia sp.]